MQDRRTTEFVSAINEVNEDANHLLKKSAFFQGDPADYIREQFMELVAANQALRKALQEMEQTTSVLAYTETQTKTLLQLDESIASLENDLAVLDKSFDDETQQLLQRSNELVEDLLSARGKRALTPPRSLQMATKVTHHLQERAQEIEEKQPPKYPSIKRKTLRSMSTQARDSQLIAINSFINQVVDKSAKEMVDQNVASCVEKLEAARTSMLSSSTGYLDQHHKLVIEIRMLKAKKTELILAKEFAVSESQARVSHKVMRLLLRVYHVFMNIKAAFATFFSDKKRQRGPSYASLFELDERLHAAEIKLQSQMKKIWCYVDDDNSFDTSRPSVNAKDIYTVAAAVDKEHDLSEVELKVVLDEDILHYQDRRERNIIAFRSAKKNVSGRKSRLLSYSELIDDTIRPACLLLNEIEHITGLLNIKPEESLYDQLAVQTKVLEYHRPVLFCDEELANLRSECEVAMNNETEKYNREIKSYTETLNTMSLNKQNIQESLVEIKKISSLRALHARPEYKKMFAAVRVKLDAAEKQLPLACGQFMLCKPKSLKQLYQHIHELRTQRQLLQSSDLQRIKLRVCDYLDEKVVRLDNKIQELKRPELSRQHEDNFLRAHFLLKQAFHGQCYRVTKDYMIALHAVHMRLVLHAQQCNSSRRKKKALDALQALRQELDKFYYLQNGKLRLPFAYYLNYPDRLDKEFQLPEETTSRAMVAKRLPNA